MYTFQCRMMNYFGQKSFRLSIQIDNENSRQQRRKRTKPSRRKLMFSSWFSQLDLLTGRRTACNWSRFSHRFPIYWFRKTDRLTSVCGSIQLIHRRARDVECLNNFFVSCYTMINNLFIFERLEKIDTCLYH